MYQTDKVPLTLYLIFAAQSEVASFLLGGLPHDLNT